MLSSAYIWVLQFTVKSERIELRTNWPPQVHEVMLKLKHAHKLFLFGLDISQIRILMDNTCYNNWKDCKRMQKNQPSEWALKPLQITLQWQQQSWERRTTRVNKQMLLLHKGWWRHLLSAATFSFIRLLLSQRARWCHLRAFRNFPPTGGCHGSLFVADVQIRNAMQYALFPKRILTVDTA